MPNQGRGHATRRRPRFFTSARIEFFSLCTVGGSVSVANVPHGNPEKALIFAPLTCLCSAELWTALGAMPTALRGHAIAG
jgi:hypothetical protein